MIKLTEKSEFWSEVFACPKCKGALKTTGKTVDCTKCKQAYPFIGDVPVLMPEPGRWISRWRDSWDVFFARSLKEENVVREQLKNGDFLAATRERLANWVSGIQSHRKKMRDLLKPLLGDQVANSKTLSAEATQRLYQNDHSITAYASNLLRDWGWETGENSRSLEVIKETIGKEKKLGKVLILGAGAGRLAYDIHQNFSPELTVALDFNPVLFLAARRF
ncbi:MAG: hypothetical protein AABZ55_15090, partial [Bdellovibrionota bacterium]